MSQINPAETNATRVTLRPKLTLILTFIGVFGGPILALSNSISQNLNDIAIYEEAIRTYSQYGIPLTDYINLFQSNIISNQREIWWYSIFIFIMAVGLLVSVTISIQLGPTYIRWRFFFVVHRSPWSEIQGIRVLRSKLLKYYGLGDPGPFATWTNISISLRSGKKFKIPADWFSDHWNPFNGQKDDLYSLICSFHEKYYPPQMEKISGPDAQEVKDEQQSLPLQKKATPVCAIKWIIMMREEAKLKGTPFPTWVTVSQKYKDFYGSGPSADEMERLYDAWQQNKERRLTADS